MNLNNPLLNRLFQKKANRGKAHSTVKQQMPGRDKILIPKLAGKNVVQIGTNPPIDKQKNTLIKPILGKLPPLSQKQIPRQSAPVIQSDKKTTFRQRKVSWNTSHDIPLFATEFSINTPQLQQKYEEDAPYIQKKQPQKKFKTVASQTKIQKNQQELFQYLKILQKNQQLKDQFCYMNRGQLPYSYEIVDYADVNKNQFLTVSLRGVSIYRNGQSQFTTAQKLSRQIQLYRKIKKIQFFDSYILAKTIKHWRYRSVRRKFQNQCRHISKILLNQNPILQNYYHFLFNIKQDFVKCKFLDVRISSTGDMQILKQQLKNKQAIIDKSLDYFENAIQKKLKQTIQKNMTKFRKQQRVNLTSDGKELGDQAFLPFDNKKKPMKYTQIAKLKQFQASMYRLLKMTDFVRFATKVEMVKDGLDNYASQLKSLHQKYLKRKQASFVSWINMKITITKQNNTSKAIFSCLPPMEQVEQILKTHLRLVLQKFYKKHYLLIQKKDEYFCQTYEPTIQQFPSRLDFKYFIQTSKQTMDLKLNCEQKLSVCINDIKSIAQEAQRVLLTIYQQSYMSQSVDSYMQNQKLRSYLNSYSASRQIISKWQQIVELGIANIDMSQALTATRQKFQQKFKFISNAIPNQVVKRCQALAEKIKSIYNSFKQNPQTVTQFINFMHNFNQQKKAIQQLQKKIQGILQLQQMVYKNSLRIGQTSKLHINQCTTYYRELQKRFEEIQQNQQKQRKRFYKIIDDMVQPLDQRAEQLYAKIYQDQILSNSQSDIAKCLQKLTFFELQFNRIKQKKQQLFYYQDQLKLGHKDIPNYFKLQSNLQWIIKIWKNRQKYLQFLNHVNTKGYAQKTNLNINDLKQFVRDIQLASSQLQCIQLLQNFKVDTLKVLNIMQVCKLLSANTLQDQHKNTIRQKLITKNKRIKDYLFTIQGGRTIICNNLVTQTNILDIKHEIQQVVHASSQQSMIKRSIQEIQQFWKKNKIIIKNSDLSKNGIQIAHFGRLQNQKLQQKIGFYLMSFKNIYGSKHATGQLSNRVLQQIQTCEYLKKLIEKWIQVQKEWIKLLPLMTNCPSVKHQSNVYFQFTALDNSIRKHNRQIHDLNSLKKIAEDYIDKKYLSLMQHLQKDLKQINKTFTTFLQIKRNTYHRFFFLADQELINILQNTKDAKSLAKYAGYCFNCDKLLLDKQLVSGFQTPTQIFKMRKGILKGQPDEMFKSVQQNMKTSLKFSIMSLIPKMKIGINIEQEHQNSLQSVLVADRFIWTEMSQLYLNPTSYDSYQNILRRPCQQLTKFVKKADISPDYRHKISTRLVQSMHLRQIGEQMIRLQITKDDFKWKQQHKYTIQEEQIVITQFNRKFVYGLEYYPPSKIAIPTQNYCLLKSQAYQTSLTDKVLVVTGVEGDGKRNLMSSCAKDYGCYYKQIVCNKNISIQYLLKFVQGAVLAGAWLSFYEFQHLQSKVLVQLFNEIKKILNKIKRNQQGEPLQPTLSISGNIQNIPGGQSPLVRVPTTTFSNMLSQKTLIRTSNRVMFNFITHGFSAQKVSIYQFDNFVLSQPNHKKICQWLLQANNFVQWQNLSLRLIKFLETIFPFLQRVMGSFMSILRKIIDIAVLKKRNASFRLKQAQIFAQTFKQQILQKSDENIHEILYEALHAYFFYQPPEQLIPSSIHQGNADNKHKRRKQSLSIDSKLSVLSSLLNKKVSNILVIGPRTNKSTLIRQAGRVLDRPILSIYPQASQYFFHDQTIQKLNKLQERQIIHYDGQSITRQWNDLVISGYLLLEGKKIHLKNQLIIEMRAVNNCSPSFVGSCQIVYIGSSLIKRQKFIRLSGAQNCEAILEPMSHVFGEQLQNLPENMVEIYSQFLKPYIKDIRSKNYHKLIVWFGNLLGIQGLWSRFYAGRYTDVTVNKYTQELVTIDQTKYAATEQNNYNNKILNSKSTFTMGNLLIHTKSTILYCELFRNLSSISMPIILTGKYDTGKSTIIKLLLSKIKNSSSINFKPNTNNSQSNPTDNSQQNTNIPSSSQISRISLPINLKTKQWTKLLKNSLTNIRRQSKNYLMNIGDNDIIIAVDDLDLGYQSHREYLRQLIDSKNLQDQRFEQYMLMKGKIIAAWQKDTLKENIKSLSKSQFISQSSNYSYKLFDRMIELQIPQFTKQNLSTIIRTNIQHFTKKNNMSKEVISILDHYLIKSLLITFDDITNINGLNTAASIVLATLRNLLSLPKKNVLMGVESYVGYFKMQLKVRIMQKCFNSKSLWQYNNVYDNLNKVIFNNIILKPSTPVFNRPSINSTQPTNIQPQQSILYFTQNQFKQITLSKLKQKICTTFQNLYIFDEMLKVIVLLNNQIHLFDSNCIMIGRSGTGKSTLLKVVAYLNKLTICSDAYDISETIVRCLKGQTVILCQTYLRRDFIKLVQNSNGTLYKKIAQCINDQQLQKLVTNQTLKKQYNSLVAQIPNRYQDQNNNKILNRVLSKLKNIILFDTLTKYKQAVNRFRQLNRYFVCYIDQWPAQALLNISGVNILKVKMDSMQQKVPSQGQKQLYKITEKDLQKLLAQAYTVTNRVILNEEEQSISIKKFKYFITTFQTMYKNRHEELSSKIQFYLKIYSKFSDACKIISEWERRVDIIRTQLEENIKKLDQELKVNRLQSFSFSLLHMSKEKEELKIVEKNQQMSLIKRQMEGQLKGMKKVMDKISKIVGSMQRSQMSELKKIYKSNKVVSFGLQCLCMLLGQDATQKSINKILADPNLMMKMKSSALLENKNIKVIEKFKIQYDSIKQQYELRSKQQVSHILIDWIKSVLQYWVVLTEHENLSKSYNTHKQQYNQSLKKQAQIQLTTAELKQNLLSLNSNYYQLFNKKEQNTLEYSKINIKIYNAKQLLPALQKSQQQTWEVIKQLRRNLQCLQGNVILAVVCLVYLPLRRLKLKKNVLDQVKKVLNNRSVQFTQDFMSLISKVQDAVLEDLNLVAIKQLQNYPVLIVDPERRAMSYLFDQDAPLAVSVISNTFSDLSNSTNILEQLNKYIPDQLNQKNEAINQSSIMVNLEHTKTYKNQLLSDIPLAQQLIGQRQGRQRLQQSQIPKFKRKNPILHTTDQNYKILLQKLPQNTFVIDWKYTTINTTQKIFLTIANKKKPQYFQAKKHLNRQIKNDLQKIQSYKRQIYHTICSKEIKILDDQQFVQLSSRLLNLQIQTEQNKKLQKQKIQQIQQYAKQINQQVNKVMFMVNSLKKIKNVALDLILDIACLDVNIMDNIIKWVLVTLQPKQRMGWLLAVIFQFIQEDHQQLLSVLVKDIPLKIGEIARNKKPISMSNKNYENLCKLSVYTPNLKIFCETAIRNAKQFQTWTLDTLTNQIPSLFKPQCLSILQQLTMLKIFKPKILLTHIIGHVCKILNIKKLKGYTNKQLIVKTNKRFPIIAHCSMEHIKNLCAELNNSKLCIKNLVQINDSLELKRFVWAQMAEGNWVVLHSVYDRNSREILQDIIQYVVNYEEQENFRVFVYVDQIQLTGYESRLAVTTKYNNISGQASKSKRRSKTEEKEIIGQSKYIQNIGITIYEELPSFKNLLTETFDNFDIQLPQVGTQPNISSVSNQQSSTHKSNNNQKPITSNLLNTLVPNILNSLLMTPADKQKFYFQKLAIYINICQIAAWIKYPRMRLKRIRNRFNSIASYIKQYGVPLQFNMYAIAGYLGRVCASSLDQPQRNDVQQLMQRIFDQTKINDKNLYGIPTNRQNIAMAFAGFGKTGAQIDRQWLDQKIRNNYQLLGCQQSYLSNKNTEAVQNGLNILGQIYFYNRSIKQQVPQIRMALSRLPTSPIVYSRQIKSKIFLFFYMDQLKKHNANILAAKQFLQWVNISSNQDFKQDQIVNNNNKQNNQSSSDNNNKVDAFTWNNLLYKLKKLIGYDINQLKIRNQLTNWLSNLKRKHQFLLYWNMDNPVIVLHPVLLSNFPMIASTYIIHYLSTHYNKIKMQSQSTNQNILYTLQIEFSRQTDQKQLYMTEGILLPQLVYKEFRYNFQFKMLDGIQEWNGEQHAPLIMLKMKRLPEFADKGKDGDDYQSPDIEIGTRINNQIQIVYKIQTHIDGNFQQWGLRRPMLISQ